MKQKNALPHEITPVINTEANIVPNPVRPLHNSHIIFPHGKEHKSSVTLKAILKYHTITCKLITTRT